jgi:hypothetical protein
MQCVSGQEGLTSGGAPQVRVGRAPLLGRDADLLALATAFAYRHRLL